MNRPIKFRAWDKDGHMMSVLEINFEKLTLQGERITDNQVWTDSLDEFVLMQFTGLLDKNGKEIYEGDIVKHDGVAMETPTVVKYEKGGFYPFSCAGWEGSANPEKSEVIGNNYEKQ